MSNEESKKYLISFVDYPVRMLINEKYVKLSPREKIKIAQTDTLGEIPLGIKVIEAGG